MREMTRASQLATSIFQETSAMKTMRQMLDLNRFQCAFRENQKCVAIFISLLFVACFVELLCVIHNGEYCRRS